MRDALIVILGIVVLVIIWINYKPPSNPSTPPQPPISLREFIAKDLDCDKPHDLISDHGRAVAQVCNRANDSGFNPTDYVVLELSFYKGGNTEGVSAYTKWLIETHPSVRKMMQSRDRP